MNPIPLIQNPPLALDIPTITDYKTFGTYSTSRGSGGCIFGEGD